jgi:hypothetical protein
MQMTMTQPQTTTRQQCRRQRHDADNNAADANTDNNAADSNADNNAADFDADEDADDYADDNADDDTDDDADDDANDKAAMQTMMNLMTARLWGILAIGEATQQPAGQEAWEAMA